MFETLHERVTGRVIRPGDEGYDEGRTVFYGGIDRHPGAIVRVADAADVQETVRYALEDGVEFSVRAGGHGVLGWCMSDGGITIDLRDLTGFEIDTAAGTVWAGAGFTAADFTAAAAEHGAAVGFGDTGTVGIAGLTLGGGVGFLVRKHGMTIDNLLAAEIVTADGMVRTIDAETEPDLFWAIRGGGGNFGIATRFHYRLAPVHQVVGGMLFLPASVETVEGFMAAAEAAPEDLSTIANVMTAPPMPFLPEDIVGQPILMAFMVFDGDATAGEQAIAPFRGLAEPLMDMVRPIAYPEMYPPAEEEYRPTAAHHTSFMGRVSGEDAATIMERIQEPAGMMQAVQLRTLGGAMARVDDAATAFAHRQQPTMVNVASIYEGDEAEAASQAWVDATVGALGLADAPAYMNFVGDEPGGLERAYPTATLERLRAVKRTWDPQNHFCLNLNIRP